MVFINYFVWLIIIGIHSFHYICLILPNWNWWTTQCYYSQWLLFLISHSSLVRMQRVLPLLLINHVLVWWFVMVTQITQPRGHRWFYTSKAFKILSNANRKSCTYPSNWFDPCMVGLRETTEIITWTVGYLLLNIQVKFGVLVCKTLFLIMALSIWSLLALYLIAI